MVRIFLHLDLTQRDTKHLSVFVRMRETKYGHFSCSDISKAFDKVWNKSLIFKLKLRHILKTIHVKLNYLFSKNCYFKMSLTNPKSLRKY